MSCYLIEYENGAKMMRPVLTREKYMQLRGLAVHKDYVARIRNGETDLKGRLLQFNYSCIPGEDGKLKGCKTPSTTVGMDIDIAPPSLPQGEDAEWLNSALERIKDVILEKKEELGLLMMERSATKGYHIVFSRHPEMTQEENLRWASDMLGVEYDKAAKDITRVFFATTDSEEDLLFLDDAIFNQEAVEEVSIGESLNPETITPASSAGVAALPYDKMIPEFFKMENDGFPNLKEGVRNDTIFNVVAKYLRYCTDHNPALIKNLLYPKWSFGLSESEVDSIIKSGLSRERSLTPKTVKKIIAQCTKEEADETDNIKDSNLPPEMPKALPEFIRLITSKVPDCYKPAVATQVFPAMAAHLHQVTFRYIDNVEHEAGLMSVCCSKQSIGKGCVNKPLDCINADLRELNDENKALARKWRKDSAESEEDNLGLLDDKVFFPLPLVNMTDAAFTDRLRRLEHNGDRTMFMRLDEIELLYQTNVGGNLKPDRLICVAFDRTEYGQERVAANSISDSAKMRWNWVASTTPPNARQFFSRSNSFLNGALSRLNICTIFQPKDKNFMPRFGVYDDAFQEKVNVFVERLNKAKGVILCPKVNKLIERLRLWCVDKAEEYDDETEKEIFSDFYKRSLVIAFRKAMTLFIASGNVWTQSMDAFIEWSLKYDLWCKLFYFSDLMITAYKTNKSGVVTMTTVRKVSKLDLLYEQLPEGDFTVKEIDKLKASLEIYSPSRRIICTLKKNKLIEKVGSKLFRKV